MTLLRTAQAPPASRTRRPRRGPSQRRDAVAGLIFVLPVLILFVFFRFLPIAGAGGMSLVKYRLNGDITFLGTENYRRLLHDDLFWHSLATTALYVVIFVPLMLVVSMVSALLLNSVARFVGLFRALLFLPYVTSFVMAGVIWTWIFSSDGPLNTALANVDLPKIGFLTGRQLLVLGALAVVSVWKGFGYSMLILLSGLKARSAEVLEAARVDGANAWQSFWFVTVPMMRPVIFFVLVIETITSFQVFDTMYVMTGGGPARASYSLIYFLYDEAFKFLDFGYAAAIGIVLFVIVLVLSLVQRRVMEGREAR